MNKLFPREMFEEEVAAITEAGAYSSQIDLLQHALEVLLTANPALRLETAIKLYQQDHISLGRAMEISQLDRESFREALHQRGLSVRVHFDEEMTAQGSELIQQLRRPV
jgi:predicted HTH domain antitoxin